MIGVTFHPFAYVAFALVATFIFVAIRSKADVPILISALNTLNDQPLAIVVIAIGCTMYLLSKQYQLDVSVPAGIVGAGINMLTTKGKGSSNNTPPTPPEPPKPPTP